MTPCPQTTGKCRWRWGRQALRSERGDNERVPASFLRSLRHSQSCLWKRTQSFPQRSLRDQIWGLQLRDQDKVTKEEKLLFLGGSGVLKAQRGTGCRWNTEVEWWVGGWANGQLGRYPSVWVDRWLSGWKGEWTAD